MRDCFPSSHHRHRHGYLLLMTLVLLTLTALAAVAMSRVAVHDVLVAGEAQSDLQRRWGTISSQALATGKAETLLKNAEVKAGHALPSVQKTIQLGDQQFDLTIADESAKVSVPLLVNLQGRVQAERTIRLLCLPSPASAKLHLRLDNATKLPKCFGDAFDAVSPEQLNKASGSASPAKQLTFWGDGRLNFHRVTVVALDQVCSGILDLNQTEQLVALQRTMPQTSLSDALNALQLSQDKRAAAERLLSDVSRCQSVWVTCHQRRRDYWALSVMDQTQPPQSQRIDFQW
jgi:hypothetical protein